MDELKIAGRVQGGPVHNNYIFGPDFPARAHHTSFVLPAGPTGLRAGNATKKNALRPSGRRIFLFKAAFITAPRPPADDTARNRRCDGGSSTFGRLHQPRHASVHPAAHSFVLQGQC